MEKRYTPKQIENALREAKGIISSAAIKLKCTRPTIYNYIKEFHLEYILEECRHDFDDTVEDALLSLVKDKNPAAVIFAAKTRLRDRGYSERQTIDAVVTGEIEINFDTLVKAFRESRSDTP